MLAQGPVRVKFEDGPLNLNHISRQSYTTRDLARAALLRAWSEYQAEGYIAAVLDTSFTSNVYEVKVNSGPRYQWVHRLPADTYPPRTSRRKKYFDGNEFREQFSGWLSWYEDHGYPFASIEVNNLQLDDSVVAADIAIAPGPFIALDSLVIKSEQKLSRHYIKNYIGFRKGDGYDEAWFRQLDKKLSEIPFVRNVRSPEVVFRPESALIYLYLERKKANFFNGVLGIQPNEETKKVNLTGDVELRLINAFNGGEDVYLNWRRLQSQTQDLSAKLEVPYIFNLPVGAGGSLKIYRRDTSFTTVNSMLSLSHLLTGTDYLKAFVERTRSVRISSGVQVAGLSNIKSTLYGLALKLERLDYRYNPRRGAGITMEAAAGRKNATAGILQDENAESLSQYRVLGLAEGYIPIFRSHTIHLAVQGSGLFSEKIFDNEMMRLGGLRTIRGFDEESIFASSYAIGTLEYRVLLEENSNVYLFADQGWYEKKSVDSFVTDTPLGFGAGINFETGAGIFTVNYALGSQFGNPVLFRTAKISFGFRNLF